jgi:hypothetical protein
MHFAQTPGTIRPSSDVRAGTEQLVRSKKWLIPMALFANHAIPVVAGSYLLTGRFSPERTFEKHATPGPDEENFAAEVPVLRAEQRVQIVGTSSEWKGYKRELNETVESRESPIDRHDLARLFKDLDRAGIPRVDDDGSLWIEVWESGEELKVGLSANNALAAESQPRLAYQVLLARARTELKSPKHRRETMQEFEQDWAMLQRASAEMDTR